MWLAARLQMVLLRPVSGCPRSPDPDASAVKSSTSCWPVLNGCLKFMPRYCLFITSSLWEAYQRAAELVIELVARPAEEKPWRPLSWRSSLLRCSSVK